MIIILLSLSAVSAADNENPEISTDDAQDNILLARSEENILSGPSQSFEDLKDLVQDPSIPAGGTVSIENNYSYESGDIDSGIDIDQDMTIDGKGYAINANHEASIFNVIGNSHVTFINITFIGGDSATNGSAINVASGSRVSVINCTFINNKAANSGGAIYIGDIPSRDATLITGSTFENNSAKNGGAVYWAGYDGEMRNCYFENNSANDYGGAICFKTNGDNIWCYDSTFIKNSAKSGGAIYLDTPDYFPHLTLKNFTFESNVATEEGGAIYSNGFVRMFSVYFNDNNATKGSAIFKTDASEMSIEDTEFGRNRADAHAIVIDVDGNGSYTPANVSVNVTFSGFDNIANAIWNDGHYSTMNLRNVTCEFSLDGNGRSLKVFNDFSDYAQPTEDFKDSLTIWQNSKIDGEDAQLIDILIKNQKNETLYCLEDGVVVTDNTKRGGRSSLPDDSSLIVTDVYGNIRIDLKNLKAGTYTIEAKHKGDVYYTEIANTAEFTVLGEVKLEIDKTANATVVGNNTLVEFTITVNNTGTADATDVCVKDGLPSGFELVNTTEGYDTTYSCWMVDELQAGKSVSFTIIGRSVEVGNWTNYAYASCEENDTLISDTFGIEIVPTDLTIAKSASPTNVTVGENVTFTVTVTNNGKIDVSDVTITDVLDTAFSFDGTSTSIPCNVLGQKLVWNIGDLASKASKSVSFNVKAISVGNFTNVAEVTCSENTTGKSGKTNVTVNPAPSTVKGENVTVNVGDSITVPVTSENATSINYSIVDENDKTVVNGTIQPGEDIVLPSLPAGNYIVKLTAVTDSNHTSSTNTSTIEVKKILPSIDVDAPAINVGEDGVITVTVPEDATGNVTIEVEGKNYTEPVKDGKAVFAIPGLKVGSHDIKAYYSGDDKYLPNNATGAIEVLSVDVLPVEDNNVTPQKEDVKPPAKSTLAIHETANPILALFIVLALLGINTKRRK